MAVTAFWYGNGLHHLANGAIDWDTDTINLMLVKNTYTPDQDAHDFRDDIGANEVAGTGYTTLGTTIANRTRGYTGGTNVEKLDGDDVTWTTVTLTGANSVRYGVIFKLRGGASSADELIGYVDFGADQAPNGINFAVQWNAAGIFTLTAA